MLPLLIIVPSIRMEKIIRRGALGAVAVRLLSSHLGETGSNPGGVALGISYVGIVKDDAAGWRIFAEISRFPCSYYAVVRRQQCSPIGLTCSDLNPIEHFWDELDFRVRAHQARPKSIAQLMEWLQEEWRRIPVDVLQILVESMPDRVAAVIAARSGPTRRFRVIEVSMEQRRNERAGEREIPRKPTDKRHRPARFPHAKVRLALESALLTAGVPTFVSGRVETLYHTKSNIFPLWANKSTRKGPVVAERSACSSLTTANRVQFPAGSLPDFRMWESCRTMPPVCGFPRGSPVSPRHFIPALLHTHLNHLNWLSRPLPSSVTQLKVASKTASSVDVQWSEPAQNAKCARGYSVCYRESFTEADLACRNVTVLECSIAGLQTATSYDVYVAAIGNAGSSLKYTIVRATTDCEYILEHITNYKKTPVFPTTFIHFPRKRQDWRTQTERLRTLAKKRGSVTRLRVRLIATYRRSKVTCVRRGVRGDSEVEGLGDVIGVEERGELHRVRGARLEAGDVVVGDVGVQ
ncbi:hypothetical protein PR048_017906 [Dryococelus australis]|uniref:Fibronectin type-III domain-containing protein n=1 Tax=Dryococelus australis TaxID=614101 RepID=A0ABQ9HAZ3_9NEOP|nr:hypothetical protein PR048_017906 [Dryococelus australis]